MKWATAVGTCIALLAATGSASAEGTASAGVPQLAQAAPSAAYLCAKANTGALAQTDLRESVAKIKTACTILSGGIAAAGSTYARTVAPIPARVAAAVAYSNTICKAAAVSHKTADCQTARTKALSVLKEARTGAQAAAAAEVGAIKAARDGYWRTVKALKGAAKLTADATAVAAPPLPPIPADSTLLPVPPAVAAPAPAQPTGTSPNTTTPIKK